MIVGYFLTRLVNLTVIPVFCDEAIYIRWAQVMRAVQSLRFIPLSDGKQPFFMWLIIPFLKIFSDPLVAGRMVSVLAGLGTMVGVGVLSYLLFRRKEICSFASVLYLISPFCLFFDRMALTDGLLSMFGIWCLIFFVLLVRTSRLDVAMISGILLGLGLITKSPALFFAVMLPMTFVSVRRDLAGLQGLSLRILSLRILSLRILYWLVVYLFAFAIYNILRLGPEFHMIAIRNKDYVFPIFEVLKHPLNPLIGNLKSTFSWYWILLTPPIFILGVFGIFLTLKKDLKIGTFLLLWFLLPLLGQGAVAKVYTARYVLFSVPVFLVFAAYMTEQIFLRRTVLRQGQSLLVLAFLLVLFIFPSYQSFLLITNPQKAWLPKEERKGYLEMWTAGYGIKESAEYIKEVAKTRKVLVGTEGYFGTLPNGLEMYLEKVPNITIIGVGQPVSEISPKLMDGLTENRVFLLVNDTRLKINSDPRLKLISKYPKTISRQEVQENLLLFEIH